MIKSMTGYGQSLLTIDNFSIYVEVKSYNSKFLDLSLRLPRELNEIELKLRTLISEALIRGKVVVLIDITQNKIEKKSVYNEKLFCLRYAELKNLADKVNSPYEPLFEIALNATNNEKIKLDTALSNQVFNTVKEVIKKCDAFRINEGEMTKGKLEGYALTIEKGLKKIKLLDPLRMEKIKIKTKNNISEFIGGNNIDNNRLEHEFFFFIEKLDIQEECTRLQSHIDYFMATLEENQSNGKKLSFISQEIGREINTLGAKANDAEMQITVVLMKEELEKIKEQLYNVL